MGRHTLHLVMVLGTTLAALTGEAFAQASAADKAFVAKVSQGGLYEVEAGKVAAARGQAANIRDLGVMDTHDHTAVNAELHKIAAATGVTIPPGLNAEFTARLNKLKGVSADQFDAYYIADMKQIHNADGAAFGKEASEGTQPYQSFAHQTQLIVKRHLGAYDAFWVSVSQESGW